MNITEQVFESLLADTRPEIYEDNWGAISIARTRAIDNPEMAEIFGQYDRQSRITPAHLLAYSKILYWIYTGDLTIVTIPFGHEPLADCEIEDNNAMLKDLPTGTSAKFIGKLADDDGMFYWSVPVELNMIVDGIMYQSKLQPGRSPLEVGYTTYITSYYHLLEYGVLARWCYGSDSIRLIHYTGKLASELINYDID